MQFPSLYWKPSPSSGRIPTSRSRCCALVVRAAPGPDSVVKPDLPAGIVLGKVVIHRGRAGIVLQIAQLKVVGRHQGQDVRPRPACGMVSLAPMMRSRELVPR